ncbi:MAG: aminotransferase class I/II-fold pyridoxal phosphate-dependent enzyme, partial [Rhodospirillales bacterium]
MVLKVSRRGQISPFMVMDVMRAANQREVSGEDVLHLEVGQPGTSAPAGVLEAARQALAADRLGYTDAFGLPALQQRVADHYKSKYAVEISPERIAVTTGSSGAFVLSFLAAFDPGDRVAVASPGYPAYRNILSAFGIEIVDLFVGPGTNYQPIAAVVEQSLKESDTRVDGLIAASPANPTGTMIEAMELLELVEFCQDRDIRLVSDEIYHGITYGKRAETALAFTDDAIVINSFSKYYSMTGWRLGWLVVPEDLLRSAECLAQNLFISPPSLSQHAAIAAFECTDELEANVKRYAANRNLLLE